ncbi:MAG: NAD(P)/FAD-dependent oxidoreductase [Anaerolineae bacterium]|nr:NAD(P)/FAD-dependent oxidoreductase [Anaerolineae bacterium]
MSKTIIIGDGPAGLSAALLLAKLELDVTVFGIDKTSMHAAMLYNYLGIPEMTGSEYQKIARQQVANFGADLQNKRVTDVEKTDSGFVVTTEDGEQHESKYVVLAEGKGVKLSVGLGLTDAGQDVAVAHAGRTRIDGLYVVGRSTNIKRTLAIISAGQGAAAAIDIASTEFGRDVNDFDSMPKK